MARSEELGTEKEIRLPHGPVRYRERGSGAPIVFVHGLLVNGDLWRKVVPALAERYRCITPDWPLGSHALPMAPDADLTPPGLARLMSDFMAELDLREVTVVGNDTGGGLTQILVTDHPERIARLVLTPCDAFSNFPPHAAKPLQLLGYVPGGLFPVAQGMRSRRAARLLVGTLAKRPFPDEIVDSFREPAVANAGVRRDLARVFRQLRPRYTLAAAERLRAFRGPALIAWAPEDRFFPMKHAVRLAELIPDSSLVEIRDSRTFVPQDQPERLTAVMEEFLTGAPTSPSSAAA